MVSRFLKDHKYIAFKTLIESAIIHKLVILATHCPPARTQLEALYYKLIKNLLNIKANVSKETLLHWTIGDVNKYLQLKLTKILDKQSAPDAATAAAE